MCSVETQIIILDIHKYSTYVVEVFGLTFSCLLIYFLNTDNNGIKTSYKLCVTIHCTMDIGLGILHILGMFQIEAVGTTTFMTIAGPIQFINVYQVHLWSFVIANFFFTSSIFCGSITIIYRYIVIVKRITLETKKVFFMTIPIILVAGISASQYILSFGPLPEEEYKMYKKLLNSEIWTRDKIYGDDFIALTTPIYRKAGSFFSYFTIISYIIVAGIIVVFSILISSHLKGNRSNMTESTLKLEKQIQTTLLIQALFPIILGYIPDIIPLLMPALHIPFQCYIIFVGVCITYIPLINPCILLFMTPQYRKRMFNYIWKKEKVTASKTATFMK